jgi:hypothetical protein
MLAFLRVTKISALCSQFSALCWYIRAFPLEASINRLDIVFFFASLILLPYKRSNGWASRE